ncbi:MAG: TSUP family transporter [Polyangiaceae bacterium]
MHSPPLVVLALILAGFAAGFVDSIAGGGGIISLPALLAAGLPPHLALGTNKLQACLGTTMAATNYARRGLVTTAELPVGVACTAAGSLGGAALVTHLSSMWLARAIPWLLVAIFAYVVRAPRFGAASCAARLGAGPFGALFGLVLGFYDGFFGPGTGSFWMIGFIALRGLSFPQATAQTKVMNLTSNAVALAWFAAHGDVVWSLGLCVGAANVAGAATGSSLAVEKGAPLIRAFFLVAVAATLAHLARKSLGL